ncbi:GAF and ANTAR domain-containing protein [Nakamurella deserti]|uniref:GAF and ANTAR domain-containing protein n=1 Tax=Nakamurella deserti TaxID=2164074 RepID=UPI000DBE20E8|nr:GAF and ANTAR domain-containing protein [Nakamurella deserti]
MAADPIDPTGVLAELSGLLRADRDLDAILADVVAMAKRRVPGTEEAAITLVRNKKAATVASTGGMAVPLDELQYEMGYGPCLDAGRDNEVKHISDAATEGRWARYLPRAREHGLASSLSIPLPVENYLVGALNLYASVPGAFEPASLALGEALAAHITAALSHAEARRGHRVRAENLERAMVTRSIIEQAKGIIMVQRKCTAGDAFDILRQISMDENMRLAEVAAQLVESASGHRVEL